MCVCLCVFVCVHDCVCVCVVYSPGHDGGNYQASGSYWSHSEGESLSPGKYHQINRLELATAVELSTIENTFMCWFATY